MSFKKHLFFPILSAILLFLPNITFSGGYESAGLGARGSAMGGAFVGVADEWTAIYWNPAGLAKLKGTKVGVDLYLLNLTNKDPDSVANPTQAGINEARGDVFFGLYPNQQVPTINEPSKFNETKTESTSLLPSIGGYKELKNFTLGFGFYVPVGTECTWDDKIRDEVLKADISAEYSNLIGLSVATVCAAKKINEKLSLGCGLNYVMIKNEREAKKTYKSSLNSLLDYEYSRKENGSGDGFEGIFGLLCNANDKLNMGIVYRTGSKLDMDGDVAIDLLKAAISEKSDLYAEFYHPATYGIGLAYKYTPKLTLACDLARTDWSTMKKKVTFKTPSVLLKDKDESLNWKATNRYRFGARYQKNENLDFLCGIYTDGAPSPKEAQGITGVVDPKLTVLSVGMSYKRGNSNSDVNIGYAFGDRKDGVIKYEKEALAMMITFSRIF
ncbi:MAG: outer membrane protein transport protein [bacterium]|nr:outer membrane protein transport protein [bacterium]